VQAITSPILSPGRAAAPAPSGGFLGGLFGAKAQPEPEAEEEEEGIEEEAPPASKQRGGFSLFGGSKAPQQQEPEEEEAPAPKQRGGLSLFGGDNSRGEREEPQAEEKAPMRSSGLFGLFKQDVVYADEQPGAPAVPQPEKPSAEAVQRAVTKRGGKRSVKDLVPRKSQARGGSGWKRQ